MIMMKTKMMDDDDDDDVGVRVYANPSGEVS
jgi:hypothetical protein